MKKASGADSILTIRYRSQRRVILVGWNTAARREQEGVVR